MPGDQDRDLSRREFVQGLDGAVASFVEYLYAVAQEATPSAVSGPAYC
jgi:hypothetical protein